MERVHLILDASDPDAAGTTSSFVSVALTLAGFKRQRTRDNSYRERHQVLGSCRFVEGGHAVLGPEVQVSSSVPQDLDDLHHVVQVSGERQRAL